MKPDPSYYLDPFGCVKNQVDAENMMACLNNAGWKCASAAEDADLIIVNSCGFIESAKRESINAVIEWRRLYPGKKILLSGCLSQRYAKELPGELTEADAFMGVENPAKILDAISQIKLFGKTHRKDAEKDILTGERPLLSLPGSAYVKISDGCGNNCSYCAIPLIRGELRCRDIPDIVEECRALLARGIRELCIIGQDIGAYSPKEFSRRQGDTKKKIKKSEGLPELLNAISALKGSFWVRLLYIHPDHFPLEILDLMERDSRFLPYFDIPFQHASDKILAAMNRNKKNEPEENRAKASRSSETRKRIKKEEKGNCSAGKYLKLIKTIRARLPRAVIRSTFLLGFPGETEEDFAALLDFQKKAKLDWAGCFAYSREEGTAAYSMKGRVPAKTAKARKLLIEERQILITEKNMERFVGQSLDVLIEEKIAAAPPAASTGADEFSCEISNESGGETFWLGRLYCQAPDIDGAAVIARETSLQKARETPLQKARQKQAASSHSEDNLRLGAVVPCRVIARRGFDLEVRVNC